MIYYCYNKKCPERTANEPWPRSDGEFKYKKVISRKTGNPYYRKLFVCTHCGEPMKRVCDNFYDD